MADLGNSTREEVDMSKAEEKLMREDALVKKKRKALTGAFPAKIAAFFLFAVSCFIAAVSIAGFGIALTEDFYMYDSVNEAFMEVSSRQFLNAAYDMRNMLQTDVPEWEIRNIFANMNLDVDVLSMDTEKVLWGTYDGSYVPVQTADYSMDFSQSEQQIAINGRMYPTSDSYLFRVYMNPLMPNNDHIRQIYTAVSYVYELRYVMIWTALASCILAILCFCFLMCSAGHDNKREEEQRSTLPCILLDLLAAATLAGLAGILYVSARASQWIASWELFQGMILVGLAATAAGVWLCLCFYQAARSLKQGKWWRHTLIFIVLKGGYKLLKLTGHIISSVLRGAPTILTTLTVYLSISILEFIGCTRYMRSAGILLWGLEKLILLPIVVYIALMCKKLLAASEALAEGDQDYVVDTSKMFGDFKAHGENLNSIGQGISKAVAERMKSEHLKTELITNVSHDLKTPLTSIINYASLICEEKTENENIAEYSQVLLRQSERLKKLLEDLVEASKATTGNLEVNLMPCEVGVILSQSVGEYQQRLEEKELSLIVTQPEEPVRIMADGRHLWRVFDNLFNNICKYAQENSRVYLSVEVQETDVRIIFRNMSKYPLNISPEELEERFVRGDRSRHMEGNGLGLSIAKSLMDLQNGKMDIVTDGDLFKVTLCFKQL